MQYEGETIATSSPDFRKGGCIFLVLMLTLCFVKVVIFGRF